MVFRYLLQCPYCANILFREEPGILFGRLEAKCFCDYCNSSITVPRKDVVKQASTNYILKYKENNYAN